MIISEVFIFYLIVTAGLAMVGMLLWTARATLLAWLWPAFLVIFLVVLSISLNLFRDF